MAAETWALLVDGTPAGPDVLAAVVDVVAEVDLEQAGVLRLRLSTSPGSTTWSLVDDGTFARLARLTLVATVGLGLPTVVVDAHVVETATTFDEEPGISSLEVVALDATAVMNLEEKVRPWANLPDSLIAATVFAEHGLVPVTAPTTTVRTELETTVMQRDSDIRFLRHLARRNGFDVYVQPTPVPGVVEGHFHPPLVDLPPQAVLTLGMGQAGNLGRLEVREDSIAAVSATVAGVDVASAREVSASSGAATSHPLGATPAHAPGARATLPPAGGSGTAGEVATLAGAVSDRSAWTLTATGSVDTSVLGSLLVPGRPVLVRGVGRRYGGAWQVTRVRHHLTVDRHRQEFTLRRNATDLTGAESFVADLALPG